MGGLPRLEEKPVESQTPMILIINRETFLYFLNDSLRRQGSKTLPDLVNIEVKSGDDFFMDFDEIVLRFKR